jgi:hypothetical protein
MMDPMGADDGAETAKSKKRRQRHPPVDEAVVYDEVRNAERAHPDAGAERGLPGDARRAAASEENERDCDGSVENGQRVIRFESCTVPPRLVVRSMNVPKPRVPDAAMEKRGPEIHGNGNDSRDRGPYGRMNDARAHGDALGRTT